VPIVGVAEAPAGARTVNIGESFPLFIGLLFPLFRCLGLQAQGVNDSCFYTIFHSVRVTFKRDDVRVMQETV
jgi:hypothetical protein